MSHRVCPSWMGYLLQCPIRRLRHNPEKILAPYLTNGMTVLEIGPAMGFFTLPMARMVGPAGKVVCVDVQPKMLAALRRRAAKAGLGDRIDTRACEPTTLGVGDLAGRVDFVLLFYVVHEVPDVARLFTEIATVMKPGTRCLVAEPTFHVTAAECDRTVGVAETCGLRLSDRPVIKSSRAAVLEQPRG